MTGNRKQSGTVNIHGREYMTVALRVQNFREAHPKFRLLTEIVSRDDDTVVMRAVIQDEAGNPLATGHAEEKRAASQINRTSALENCETSAIGRALAALGLGGTEFASANEVENAIHQQGGPITPASGALDALPELEQLQIRKMAETVRETLANGSAEEAYEVIEAFSLGADHKVALWTLLDSKERAALKKAAKKEAA